MASPDNHRPAPGAGAITAEAEGKAERAALERALERREAMLAGRDGRMLLLQGSLLSGGKRGRDGKTVLQEQEQLQQLLAKALEMAGGSLGPAFPAAAFDSRKHVELAISREAVSIACQGKGGSRCCCGRWQCSQCCCCCW